MVGQEMGTVRAGPAIARTGVRADEKGATLSDGGGGSHGGHSLLPFVPGHKLPSEVPLVVLFEVVGETLFAVDAGTSPPANVAVAARSRGGLVFH